VARELGLKVALWIVLLGGHKIELNVGFSIWSGIDGGLTDGRLTEDDDGSGTISVFSFVKVTWCVVCLRASGQIDPLKHINMCTRRGLIMRIARTAPRRGGLSNHGLLLWKRLSKQSG
jgi:hypothetical protein